MARRRAKPISLAGRPAPVEPKEDVRNVVRKQPHRRDGAHDGSDLDQKRESAWGRFILRNKLSEDVWSAGWRFENTLSRWRALRGIPAASRPSTYGGSFEPTDATVEALWADLRGMENAMKAKGLNAYLVVTKLLMEDQDICEDRSYAAEQHAWGVIGAAALAEHLGYMTRSRLVA